MHTIRNIELLPGFFDQVKQQYGAERLRSGKFVLAIMSDLLPGADEVKRCVKMAYESRAMESILSIAGDPAAVQLHRMQAVERMVDFSFMDRTVAETIVDAILAAVCPNAKPREESADELYDRGVQLQEKGDQAQAFSCFQKAADMGHITAQFMAGYCYLTGAGAEEDLELAALYLQEPAQRGFIHAQAGLGLCYDDGPDKIRDWNLAVHWYRKVIAGECSDEIRDTVQKRLDQLELKIQLQELVGLLGKNQVAADPEREKKRELIGQVTDLLRYEFNRQLDLEYEVMTIYGMMGISLSEDHLELKRRFGERR